MLRITIDDTGGSTHVGVEGSLTRPWAEELEKWWNLVSTGAPPHPRVEVNLSGMTNIDSEGKQIIKRMHISGVTLVGSGVMTRAVIDEVTRSD